MTPSCFCLAHSKQAASPGAWSTSSPRLGWASGGFLLLLLALFSEVAQAQRPQLRLGLLPLGGTDADSAIVYFQSGATADFDLDFDASKLVNPSGLNLASIAANGQQLATNGLPPSLLGSSLTVPLAVGGPTYGAYTLEVGRLANFPTTTVYLTDALQQTSTRLASGTSYAFELTAANTTGTYATSTRFALQFVPGAPLPVVLTFFGAQAQTGGVQLTWETASERSSAFFLIERSADGVRFMPVGQVVAAGTSAAAHRYAWLDIDLPVGTSQLYYRLRQVDLDGTVTYSPVRSITRPEMSLSLFPNPTSRDAILRGAPAGGAVEVHDVLGRAWLYTTVKADGTIQLELPPGAYLVRTGSHTLHLLVQ